MQSTTSAALLHCLSRPGPSRLASRLSPCSQCLRRASTESAPSSTEEPHSPSLVAAVQEQDVDAAVDAVETPVVVSTSSGRDDLKPGYDNWLKSVGRKWKYPSADGGPNWMGGNIPFSTNPSFRPPPPLSDMLREMIHLDHLGYVGSPSNKSSTSSRAVSTGLSVAKLSEKYGISKARVEAVLRLKADEKQWEKSGKTFQTPFLQAMEKYLAVRQPRDLSRPHMANHRTEQAERSSRLLHPSSAIEAVEEASHEAAQREAMGDGGHTVDETAFTARDTIRKIPGLERGAWEFKDEEVVAGAIQEATEAMKEGKDATAPFKSPEFRTPYSLSTGHTAEAEQAVEAEQRAEDASKMSKVGKTVFRFVDVGGMKEVRTQHAEGAQAVKEYRRKKKLEKKNMNKGK